VNIQEYISSGIVESYVLGLADASEREEFESMCASHPEVRDARDKFEISLEEYAMLNKKQPPAHVKNKIFSALELTEETTRTSFSGGGSKIPPVSYNQQNNEGNNNEPSRAKVMALSKEGGWQRMLAAAAVILLVFSTVLNFYFFNRYKEYNDRYQALVLSQTELALHNQVLQTRLLDYEKAVDMMKDPNMAIVKMPAIPNSPDPTSATMVLWDTVSKDVYLAVNKLPAPTSEQQYQLWALVDGKPVDAGVFDMKEGETMHKMKNIPRAQAFAITLEKKGGSRVPTMEKLYVMGKV
jgi:anti-sigma-K factor RskA